ncbi:hypothetical protein TNCV_5031001 [Trichonephila clavipes]|nr:hypothetical protein TNCV_5031001 [Trichonephila clavipes]
MCPDPQTTNLDGFNDICFLKSFLPQWLDSPGWVLAFSRSLFQASLLPASVMQFLVLKARRFFSWPSNHLRLYVPFLHVPIGWALKTFLMVQSSSILTTSGLYRVSLNAVYKLGEEVENIVRSYSYTGKHGRKAIGGAVREFERSVHVISSFQTWTACDERESLYERRVGGCSLHLRPRLRKSTCCCSVVWREISNEVATESSNVHSSASESGGAWIFRTAIVGTGRPRIERTPIFEEGVLHAVDRNPGTIVPTERSRAAVHRVLPGKALLPLPCTESAVTRITVR